jgi:hypothetical protein
MQVTKGEKGLWYLRRREEDGAYILQHDETLTASIALQYTISYFSHFDNEEVCSKDIINIMKRSSMKRRYDDDFTIKNINFSTDFLSIIYAPNSDPDSRGHLVIRCAPPPIIAYKKPVQPLSAFDLGIMHECVYSVLEPRP